MSYSVIADLPVKLQIVSPAEGSRIDASDSAVELDVLVQLTGLDAGHRVSLRINDGAALAMNVTGDTARLTAAVSLLSGENELIIEVRDASDAPIARARRTLISEVHVAEAFALLNSEPAAGSQYQRPMPRSR